jgi:hypothetical protein
MARFGEYSTIAWGPSEGVVSEWKPPPMARLMVTADALAAMLDLPEGVEIVNAQMDQRYQGLISIVVKADHLPKTMPGQELPCISITELRGWDV